MADRVLRDHKGKRIMRTTREGRAPVRVGKGSRIVADRWYYDPTYLLNHDGRATLFLRHFAVVETAAGNRTLRIGNDVEAFDNDDDMVTAIEARHMSEAPQEYNDDRGWVPPELVV